MCIDFSLDYFDIWQLQIEDDKFLRRSSGSRITRFGKMSSLANYIHDLANAKIIIFHRQLSINGEALVYFFKLLSRALGGHAITWQKEKIILIERCSAINIFGYFPNKQCSRAAYFLSYTSYALACGVTNPKYLEDYGKHKLIRYREPPMITPAQTIEDKGTTPGQSVEAITQVQEVETQVLRAKTVAAAKRG